MGHAIDERPTLADTRGGGSCGGNANNEAKTDVHRTAHAGNTPSPPWACRYIGEMTTVIITPKSNGPLIIEGPVRIVTPDGQELTPPPRKDGKPAEVVVLCRCGGSATKPFCDGTHKRNGFQDAQGTPS
jgi:CDGSH-type Zn-finger protein